MEDTGCAACGAETLLFECSHCGRAYCANHEYPDHSCEETPVDDELTAAGFVTLAELGPDPARAEPAVRPISFGGGDRDAAREARPDSERRWPTPDARGLPQDRRESLEDWFRRQSVVGYALKIGGLALLLTGAYFIGLAATLYGFV